MRVAQVYYMYNENYAGEKVETKYKSKVAL